MMEVCNSTGSNLIDEDVIYCLFLSQAAALAH